MSPPESNSPPKDRTQRMRQSYGRSKNGCSTCRARKVKCDEVHPRCHECSRQNLLCDWTRPPSVKERRDGWKKIRGKSVAIRRAASQISSQEAEPSDFHVPRDDSLDLEGIDESFPIQNNTTQPVVFGSVGHLPAPFDNTFPLRDGDLLGMYGFDMSQAVMWQPPSPMAETLLGSSIAYDSLPGDALTLEDRVALDFYGADATFGFGSKKPQYSTHAILRRRATHSPMLHQLLLAAASAECWYARGKSDALLQENATKKYAMGQQMLFDRLLSQDSDPMEVLPSFWFLYINHRRGRRPVGMWTAYSRLSLSMADYIKASGLLDIILPPTDANHLPGSGAGRKYRPKDKALLARLITWLFWVDTQACFQGEGGAMADTLWQSVSMSAEKLGEIFEISSEELRLNHEAYPQAEWMDDLRNKRFFKVLHQIWMIHHEINRLVVSNGEGPYELDESQCREIEVKIEALRRNTTLSSMLIESQSEAKPRGRDLSNCDWAVANFYSLIIYQRRCSTQVQWEGYTHRDNGVLDKLLTLIQRSLAVPDKGQTDRMQWPLFWAGIEADTQFSRDWISDKLVNPSLNNALQIVLMEQADGSRISVRRIREICQLTCSDIDSRLIE
ncbi:hypothetical protein QBC37DRAFT_18806 [Rhypophila decipiens]|uniref:Zn(2)-C6 fungal-type domain-containing protein n=1 Tax=Rhypophila decipiens TaxID=261697 RepID=A0AAN6Y238_9PEZI|nr:hypothetical protein QBC37DRAFT_18806 [Rhypophila decipiens]